ncbi:MAG: hypothetical protein ACI97A_004329 [Planctomycetota bacterium]|jgi:uncharacterized protein YndB with AHSA1/START domain
MKYELDIELDLPRARVMELFDNPDNLAKWQEGFVSMEPISGTPGETGAKSQLNYLMGKREIELVETITTRNLPKEFSATYEAKNVWNKVENFFTETPDGKTHWNAKHEFRCGGFLKIMAFVFPGAFKKQSFKFMEMFKEWSEKEG